MYYACMHVSCTYIRTCLHACTPSPCTTLACTPSPRIAHAHLHHVLCMHARSPCNFQTCTPAARISHACTPSPVLDMRAQLHTLTTYYTCTVAVAHPHHVLDMSAHPHHVLRMHAHPHHVLRMHAHPHHVLDMRAHPHHILDMRAHPHRSPHTTHACTLIPLYYACMHSCTPSPRIIHECKTLYLLHMLAHAHPRYAPRTSQFCMLGYACTFSPHCHAACMRSTWYTPVMLCTPTKLVSSPWMHTCYTCIWLTVQGRALVPGLHSF